MYISTNLYMHFEKLEIFEKKINFIYHIPTCKLDKNITPTVINKQKMYHMTLQSIIQYNKLILVSHVILCVLTGRHLWEVGKHGSKPKMGT